MLMARIRVETMSGTYERDYRIESDNLESIQSAELSAWRDAGTIASAAAVAIFHIVPCCECGRDRLEFLRAIDSGRRVA